MTGEAIVCRLTEHIPIEGADRIVQCSLMGETIITQKTTEPGTLGILFDCETQLSHEFCYNNSLYSDSSLNADPTAKGYIGKNRRIRPIKLRGVRCSAMFMFMESLSYLGDFTHLDEGTQFTELAGKPVCCKYEPPRNQGNLAKGASVKKNLTPTFKEHMDTDHLGRNAHKIQTGDIITVTEKLHGTSGRCGYLQTVVDDTSLIDKWMRKMKIFGNMLKTKLEYDYVVGSRRVVKSIGFKGIGDKQHYYDQDLWTQVCEQAFDGKLAKGETVYFEIVGFTPDGGDIMPGRAAEMLKPYMDKKEYKSFVERYGEQIQFRYGSEKGTCKVFIYRVTTTNEEGKQIDLSWKAVKKRAVELGVNHVPEIGQYIYDGEDHEDFTRKADVAVNAFVSPTFPATVPEGFCYRVDNGDDNPILLKHKSFLFKALEGILRDDDVRTVEEDN